MTNIALVYDADYTLMEGYHPSVILKRRGIDIDAFWKKVAHTQKIERERGDPTSLDIIYLAHFMHEIRYGKLKGLTIRELEESAADVDAMLYPGLPDFFAAIKAEHPNCRISHNVVSVGIKHILDASALGKHMDRVYGYTFFDDLTPGDAIDEIRSTSSSSEKVTAIVGISYGTSESGFEFPIPNMVYVGDGQTDRAAFRFVKKRGGLSVCVYDPKKPGAFEKAQGMKGDVHYVLPADYSKGTSLWHVLSSFIQSRAPVQLNVK